jgi:hypothetical protein
MEKETNTKSRNGFAGRRVLIYAAVIFPLSVVGFFAWQYSLETKSAPTKQPEKIVEENIHQMLPAEVRGVYFSAATAGREEKFPEIITAVKAKGINSLVVDAKNADGSLAFTPVSSVLADLAVVSPTIKDLDATIKKIHAEGMYLIARVPVFEDPSFAIKNKSAALKTKNNNLWKDVNGLVWTDPAAEAVWEYTVLLSRELYARGFDEIQFDYVRFPTDGDLRSIAYPYYNAKRETKRETMERFFAYLNKELRSSGIPISADLFGFTTWRQNDLGIGQWYDDVIRQVDFVSPMVYPSHYPPGTLTFSNPAAHPYEIVYDSLTKGDKAIVEAGRDGVASQRPWLQAFNMGAVYTEAMISLQIKATREAKGTGFLFWSAANNYSVLPDVTKN